MDELAPDPHRGQTSEHARECGCDDSILVPRGRAPFGQHQESRLLVLTKRSAASKDENVTTAASSCEFIEAKYYFTSMKFIGDDREEEEEIMTRIVLE